jgi:hypothetical protein
MSPRQGYELDESFTAELDGKMTLDEVASKYGIPSEELAQCIQVPITYSGERLGRLRKKYGFRLKELKDFIQEKKETRE